MRSYNAKSQIDSRMSELLLAIIRKITLLIRQNNKKEVNYKAYETKKRNHNKFSQ